MKLKNIVRSVLPNKTLSIIYIGTNKELLILLSSIGDIYCTHNIGDNVIKYDGLKSYDCIILDDISFNNIHERIKHAENVPSIFLATQPPFKKETAWMIKNTMKFNTVLATDESLYPMYYSYGPIFNITDKEEAEKCLKTVLNKI